MFKRDHVKFVAALSESVGREALARVALDSKQDLLYYTHNSQGFIGEITTDGTERRTLFNTITRRPYAIVVDSSNR